MLPVFNPNPDRARRERAQEAASSSAVVEVDDDENLGGSSSLAELQSPLHPSADGMICARIVYVMFLNVSEFEHLRPLILYFCMVTLI